MSHRAGQVFEDIDPGDGVPDGLRTAIEATGSFEDDFGLDPGINMRVLCALAGLSVTVDDLRQVLLLAAPFS